MLMAELCCPECGSQLLYKDGLRYLSDGSTVQRWLCRNCGYRFSEKSFKNCLTHRLSDAHQEAILMEVEKAIGEKREAGATESAQQDVKGKIVELLWQLERNGRTQGTIANYRKTLMRMFRENVNLNDPEECKAWLSKKEFAANTKRNIATILDKWFEYLGVAWVKPSYCGEPEIPFIPTEQELDCLIASVGKKMACYLQLLKDTGARCGEISNLKWTDVDFEQRTVRVKGEKGSYSRMLPISVKAVEMLKNLPKTEDRIFADANHMRACFYVQRKRAARKLGNPRLMQITFHTFRHWKGTMLYHQTKDIYHVKEYLGHKNLQSTQVYIHIEKAMFRTMEPDEYHVKVAETKEDIIALLEEGFEFVMEKDGLAYFRKRK
ncbi:MAG: tyrosine-type recombinase/integrase [Candidatus Bathyarchaeia archaeon]